jgi:hypothetical protein
MVNKQNTVTMQKPWFHIVSSGANLHQIIAKLRYAMEIPLGYEDETGFHFGAEPDEKKSQWPPAS